MQARNDQLLQVSSQVSNDVQTKSDIPKLTEQLTPLPVYALQLNIENKCITKRMYITRIFL